MGNGLKAQEGPVLEQREYGMRKIWILNFVAALGIILSGCSSGSGNTTQATTALTCSATASVLSGTPSVANSSVQIDNVIVQILNATVAPYTVTLPGLPAQPALTTQFNYNVPMYVTTSAAYIVGTLVYVADSAGNSGSCSLNLNGSATGSSTVLLTASPNTTPAINTAVTIIANNTSGLPDPIYSFSLGGSYSGVSFTPSTTTATIISSIAQAVIVNVSMTDPTGATAPTTNSITIVFGGSGGTAGSLQVQASPLSSEPAGTPITLSAYDSANPGATFNFAAALAQSGVSVTPISSYSYTVNSSVAQTVQVNVTEIQAGTTVSLGTWSYQVTFTSGGTNCIVTSGSYCVCPVTGCTTGVGNMILTLNPSTGVAPVGTPITIQAYDSSYPSAYFQISLATPGTVGLSIVQMTNTSATVSSLHCGECADNDFRVC